MSFRLTGPLFNSTSGNMIEILSPHVTVDLNGFAITCLLPSCSGMAIISTEENVTVMNGTVRGYAEGVSVTGGGARVENVRAIGNGVGVHLGNSCAVHNTVASGNTGDGIKRRRRLYRERQHRGQQWRRRHLDDCRFQCDRNTVRGNTGHGLSLATQTGYSTNVVSQNVAGTVLNGVPAGGNVCNGTTVCP